uniref:Protein kinase domain-containing protein n=1 Tax=Stegastes partitus TaxID=144197 RepID=A0A3B5A8C0_9TELE
MQIQRLQSRSSNHHTEELTWRRKEDNTIVQFFNRVFMRAVISGVQFPIGVGENRKEAKQNAAKSALRSLDDKENQRPVVRPTVYTAKNVSSKPAPVCQKNITAKLVYEKTCVSKMTEVMSIDIALETVLYSTKSQFDFKELLGSGAFGQVYKVIDKLLDKHFALKIVRFKEIRKAVREAKAMSDLYHPHIVRCYSAWVGDSGYQWDSTDDSSSSTQSSSDSSEKFLYIQMELCDTRTLKEWIDENNKNTSNRDSKRRKESLDIVLQIVDGVEYIHSKKFIHRDLKPSNIMFGQEGQVKIGDFGLRGERSHLCPTGKTITHNKPYGRKVDIFPLGLIYFELLWKISTFHEKDKVSFRGKKPPEEFSHRFTEEVHLHSLSVFTNISQYFLYVPVDWIVLQAGLYFYSFPVLPVLLFML